MNISPYPYTKRLNRYSFISVGKKQVRKVVEFDVLGYAHLYNLGFGDLLPEMPESGIDDFSNTDNGDMIRVLATVVTILIEFLNLNPQATVVFSGSTETRTNLYRRIIKRYYPAYKHRYEIMASYWHNGRLLEGEFDPFFKGEYVVFFVKRKY
jgi:hypothetical protein